MCILCHGLDISLTFLAVKDVKPYMYFDISALTKLQLILISDICTLEPLNMMFDMPHLHILECHVAKIKRIRV